MKRIFINMRHYNGFSHTLNANLCDTNYMHINQEILEIILVYYSITVYTTI